MSKNKTIHAARGAGAGCRAVNVLRVAAVVAVTETVTIGSDVFEAWLGGAAVTAGRIKVDVSAGGTKTSPTPPSDNTNVADGGTVTIDTKGYTYKTALPPTEGEDFVCADADGSPPNFICAINHTGTPGTDYSCAAAHPTVSAAAAVTAHAFLITSLLTGTGPNAIATTETSAHLSWGATTLASGANPTGAQFVTALTAAINTSGTQGIGASAFGANEMLVYSRKSGNFTAACTETLGGSNNAWHAAAMYGGHTPKIQKSARISRVPITGEVTLGNMHFHFPFTVGFAFAAVRVTSSGAAKAWDGALLVSGNRVTVDNSGATDWATTDTVYVHASE